MVWVRCGISRLILLLLLASTGGGAFSDGGARNADMEWHRFEEWAEWHEQLEDSALLGLGAEKLFLERLR